MRNLWSVLCGILIMLIIGGISGWVESQDVPRMGVDELRGRLNDPQVVVLDVRAGRDWKSSQEKIAGAVREEPGELDWAQKYDKNKTLVLYCA